MSSEPADQMYKVIIIGESGVGKTCFFLQFTEGSFKEDHNVTIGVEYGSRIVKVNEKNIKLELWDTAGQEAFRAITRSFYRNANAVLLMYDVTRYESFHHLTEWMNEVKTHATPDVTTVLVGNMLDLADEEREVETSDAEEFYSEHKLDGFFEASAKTCENVVETFTKVAEVLVKKHPKASQAKSTATPAPILIRDTTPEVKKKGCCG